MENNFQAELKSGLQVFLEEQKTRYPHNDLLRIDLHCHDRNSDEPDELLGRILNVSETWLPGERLMRELQMNGCNAFTVTNHNNARSCYELRDKGFDILTGCEFSCIVPDCDIGIHVLAYGFSPEQEVRLNKLRRNVYLFQEYALKHDIPTVWAHPLYHYQAKRMPTVDFFRKMALVFERFEVLNGQRNTWQNMLVKEWITSLTPDRIDDLSKEFDLDPSAYCFDKYKKSFTGGSDSHIGIFAGLTGTNLYIPNLQERLKNEPSSALALEAIRRADMIPYGSHQNAEKLTVAFLDYVSQVALNYKDPGLMRLLLHRGSAPDKILAFLLSNIFLEIQRHKVTISFVRLFHESLMGKSPSFLKKFALKPSYKPIFDEIEKMAKSHRNGSHDIVGEYNQSIHNINEKLNEILFSRVSKKIEKLDLNNKLSPDNIERLLAKLDLPSHIRSYLTSGKADKNESAIDLADFLDGLSFPFFASALVLSAHYTSAKVLFNTRPFLKAFSRHIRKYEHPQRALWLTDTFGDKNSLSTALQSIHRKIKDDNLPIDMLVCSSQIDPDEHLIVLPPLCEFSAPLYSNQPVRVPNLLDLHKLFHEREYDRIVCSTEGVMGLMALYLKSAYSVEASFYVYTDWVMFARKVLNLNKDNLNRIRRMLRAFYGSFDRVFVLNTDQQKWLTGHDMKLHSETVKLTAHWADEIFIPQHAAKKELFGVENEVPVILYAGMLSVENGVMELPEIYRNVRKTCATVQLVIAGQGPADDALKNELPEAVYLNRLERDRLPAVYSCADLFVFPSRFDTFGRVALEALSCGLPVVAYNTKGTKDIIVHERNGYILNTPKEMTDVISSYLQNRNLHSSFRKAAAERANDYKADRIMNDFMNEIGLG
ncbi:MAG: glycosyltransferase [Tannerella sp.]|jgi:glycosyltransferase involved in cell wall biosynthesis|nr:glycosyltransferase [Tannerella sp.]